MPEELKMLLAGLAKAAAEGKVRVGNADDLPKEVKDIVSNLVERSEEVQKIAELSKELGDSMKPAIVAAAKVFVETQGLPEEAFLDYVIYGAISNTLRFVLEDDENDDCECDCCRCQPPKNSPSNDSSAKSEIDSDAAINALKAILGSKRS